MKTHNLKTWPIHFDAISMGSKTCEVRLNDRDFRVDDILCLEEWSPTKKEYTGKEKLVKVTHIIEGGQFGIEKGYVVMSIY